MKTVIKHLKKGILMGTMFATLLSFANEPSFCTIKKDAKRTLLTLNNVKQGNLLSIIDDNGIILYKELIEKTGVYIKGFDLTSLPDGEYIFELDKDLEVNTIPFTVTASSVVFNKENGKVTYKPYSTLKNGIVYLTKLALNEEPLKVDIYFSTSAGSELMYSEKIENTKNIQKAYKLKGLGKGKYKFVFKTEGRIFTKNI